MIGCFGEQIAEGCAEWSRQHEGEPEQKCPRHRRPGLRRRRQPEQGGDAEGAGQKTQPQLVSDEVASGGAQGVGDQKREPIQSSAPVVSMRSTARDPWVVRQTARVASSNADNIAEPSA